MSQHKNIIQIQQNDVMSSMDNANLSLYAMLSYWISKPNDRTCFEKPLKTTKKIKKNLIPLFINHNNNFP